MAFINHLDLAAAKQAVKAGDLAKLGEIIDKVSADLADDSLIETARDKYQTDEVEIDDHAVATSVGEDGVWVAAWVFLPYAEEDEAE